MSFSDQNSPLDMKWNNSLIAWGDLGQLAVEMWTVFALPEGEELAHRSFQGS